jgi:hypothetical protein
MKIVTDHGWPKASDGSDGRGLEAFKNERDYIAQSGHHKTTVAAMDWSLREIERLQDIVRDARDLVPADIRTRIDSALGTHQ